MGNRHSDSRVGPMNGVEPQREARAADGAAHEMTCTPLLADALGSLDRHDLRYCVLRGGDGSAAGAPLREVDLLVDARQIELFSRALLELGFVPVAAWGRGGHRFFVAYEQSQGKWLKMDVVTSLRYGGRHRPYSARELSACLERRRRDLGVWCPDLADGLLGLVLHCVLDKGEVKEEHRRELRRLQNLAEADEAFGAAASLRFATVLRGAMSWSATSAAIAAGAWERLLEQRRRIAWELFRRDPVGCSRRWIAGELERFLSPIFTAFRRKGFTVALVGPDGAGKSTLARALAGDPQLRARIVYMGSNASVGKVGLASTRWIGRRQIADRTGAARGALLAIAYGNRLLEQMLRSFVALVWSLRGRFVVFDRHPCERLIAEPAKGLAVKLRIWLLEKGTLRPDVVMVLDAPADILHARKREHALEWIQRHRDRYRFLASVRPDFVLLDASAAKDEIVRRATSIIWGRYRQHVMGAS